MTLLNACASARRHPARLIAAALVAVVSTGCGSSGGSSAGTSPKSAANFVRNVTTQFSRGQAGRLWDSLTPADQAVVTRARYTACQSNEGFALQKFKVLETYADTIDVAGKPTPSTAVSVQVTSDDGLTTATMHAVSVARTWRWILPASEYAAYKQGRCPAS
jgi:hypothetical protein